MAVRSDTDTSCASTAVLPRASLAADGGRPPEATDATERPVFVVGAPRSGTTFMGSSLGGLPGFVDPARWGR